MPKRRRKNPECQNCHYVFEEINNYCPRCGQENHEKIRSIPDFAGDLFQDLIQVDNKLFRSLKPFLFYPGGLTNSYINGRRVHYINPVRLYLACSVLYFFVVTFEIKKNTGIEDQVKSNKELLSENVDTDKLSNTFKIDSTRKVILEQELVGALSKEDSARVYERLEQIENASANFQETTTEEKNDSSSKQRNNVNLNIFDEFELSQINAIAEVVNYDEAKVLDSLGKENTYWNKLIVRQSIRLANSSPREIVNSVLERIPILMFVLLPIFAFYLSILYFRSKRFYVEHFVFTLHIHSFYFFLFTIGLIILDVFNYSDFSIFFVLSLSFFILFIYSFASFINVYKQNWFKTLLKMTILAHIYSFTLVISFAIGVVLSLIFF